LRGTEGDWEWGRDDLRVKEGDPEEYCRRYS